MTFSSTANQLQLIESFAEQADFGKTRPKERDAFCKSIAIYLIIMQAAGE